MKSFWNNLPKPFTVLAPMEGVTDIVFRQIITEIGRPDVFFTEFTSCTGLLSVGRARVEESLRFDSVQKPIVAQIWGTNPQEFYEVARELNARGFDGIDINMGCPAKAVVKHGTCSALIKNPTLAQEIIKATIEGAGNTPVSVKTRIGYLSIAIDEWLGFLLHQNLAALTVHLRTVKELSRVPARWELMPDIISLRNKISPSTIIIGNGDIDTLGDVDEKYQLYKAEGYMIGTGIFANPWLFNKKINMTTITIEERIKIFTRHIALFEKQWGMDKNFAFLKKFAKTYVSNFPESAIFREKLMKTTSLDQLKSELSNYKNII